MASENPKTPIRTVQVSEAAKAKVANLQREYRLRWGEEIGKAAVAEACILAGSVDCLPEPNLAATESQAA